MDARLLRFTLTLGAWLVAASIASAASWKTDNFVVTAPTEALAKKVAFTAEQWRVRLAKEWLGHTLPKWYRPCPITVNVGQIGAGGATTFRFAQGQVFDWRMNVQGTEERILDSVIPHEVSHTVFASHFRRALPRWADEGAATLAEHESEQHKQMLHLRQVWNTSHKIPLGSLLSMEDYPTDMRDVLTLYAQGYSLADFLVQKGGRAKYLQLLEVAEKKDWETALRELYGIEGVKSLDSSWGHWVVAGSPPLDNDRLVAARDPKVDPTSDEIIRGQTPDADADGADADTAHADAAHPDAVSESAGINVAARPRKTAELSDDFTGFLPPRPVTAMGMAATPTGKLGNGKEPRPAPLPSFSSRTEAEQEDSNRATEMSGPQEQIDRRLLPRTSRADAKVSDPVSAL
jgi:hypothetical protein